MRVSAVYWLVSWNRNEKNQVQILTQPWDSLDYLGSVDISQSNLSHLVVVCIKVGDMLYGALSSLEYWWDENVIIISANPYKLVDGGHVMLAKRARCKGDNGCCRSWFFICSQKRACYIQNGHPFIKTSCVSDSTVVVLQRGMSWMLTIHPQEEWQKRLLFFFS